MGRIVDPDTGRLVSAAVDKAAIDAQVRVLIPAGDRVLDRNFGSRLLDAFDGQPDGTDSLPASIQAALTGAPFYTFLNARATRDGSDGLRVDLYIDIPGEEAN